MNEGGQTFIDDDFRSYSYACRFPVVIGFVHGTQLRCVAIIFIVDVCVHKFDALRDARTEACAAPSAVRRKCIKGLAHSETRGVATDVRELSSSECRGWEGGRVDPGLSQR